MQENCQYCRHGICQNFDRRKIPNFSNLTWAKRINCVIFGRNLRMMDVLLIYFEQIVNFFLLKYILTPVILWIASTSLAWMREITQKGEFFVFLWNFTTPQTYIHTYIIIQTYIRDSHDKFQVCNTVSLNL